MGVTDVHDRQRASRIRRGEQRAIDVPVTTLRGLVHSSAHARRALTSVLGTRTVAALAEQPNDEPQVAPQSAAS